MDLFRLILLLLLLVFLLICTLLLLSMNRRQAALSHKIDLQSQSAQSTASQSMQTSLQQFTLIDQQIRQLSSSSSQNTLLVHQLEEQLDDINRIMTNTKRRGSWGEYQLENLIRIYAGENPQIYDMQYRLNNGRIADGVFHLPGTEKVLCIDSKFPMENYLAMENEPEDADYYKSEFRKNMKKHINDVADKYITPETEDLAALFIPSEAVYQFVCGECDDLLQFALERHVLLVSPTTLTGVIFTLLSCTRDFYRAQSLAEIEKNLYSLKEDVQRLQDRSAKAARNLQTAASSLEDMDRSVRAVGKRLDRMIEGKGEADDQCHEG